MNIYDLFPDAEKPAWELVVANHRNQLPELKSKVCGGIWVRRYLGRPLSDDLWFNLRYRFGAKTIRVFRWGDGEKTNFDYPPCAYVYLNEQDDVYDMNLIS